MIQEQELRNDLLLEVAARMLVAARTAPKGRGVDNLVLGLVQGEEIARLSQQMQATGERDQLHSFERDAENILQAPVVVLMGTKISALGLKKCGLCGMGSCEEKKRHPQVPCVFNSGDLGIAVGSAVSVAMDCRVDNRIMYSAGLVAIEMGFLGPDVRIAYGIPLSASSKNPFFDRGK